jgi:hypothetical protein
MVDVLLYKNEYRIFKAVEITIRKEWGRMEKNGRDEPIQDTIHKYMEMS